MDALRSVDGSSVDGSLYRDVVDFAAHTAWLHGIASIYTSYGVVLFFAAMVLTWWFSRRNGAERMGFVLWAPIAAVLAYVVNDVVKNLVQEVRPCRSLPNIHPLLSCPAATDWSFPSNHAVVVAAAAVALLMVNRTIGWIAVLGALLMGASRVYVGAHYPHDVLVGLLLGALIAGLGAIWAGVLLQRLVDRLLATPARVLLSGRLGKHRAGGAATRAKQPSTDTPGRIAD